MCNPFTIFTCDTNYLEWIFEGWLGWSLGGSFVFCFGSILLLWLVVAIWGKLAGYTRQSPGLTLQDKEHNRIAEQTLDLHYYMKGAVLIVISTALVAYIIGLIWG